MVRNGGLHCASSPGCFSLLRSFPVLFTFGFDYHDEFKTLFFSCRKEGIDWWEEEEDSRIFPFDFSAFFLGNMHLIFQHCSHFLKTFWVVRKHVLIEHLRKFS